MEIGISPQITWEHQQVSLFSTLPGCTSHVQSLTRQQWCNVTHYVCVWCSVINLQFPKNKRSQWYRVTDTWYVFQQLAARMWQDLGTCLQENKAQQQRTVEGPCASTLSYRNERRERLLSVDSILELTLILSVIREWGENRWVVVVHISDPRIISGTLFLLRRVAEELKRNINTFAKTKNGY